MRAPTDRVDELRAATDLWPLIQREITAARFDALATADHDLFTIGRAELEAKFRKGEAEHGRNWLGMTRADLDVEIRAEIIDLVLYHAMVRARWNYAHNEPATTLAFLTNRDPGDEAES